MSAEKEVGEFNSAICLSSLGYEKYKDDPHHYLIPVLSELLHKCKGTIDLEGIYKFTLNIKKLK